MKSQYLTQSLKYNVSIYVLMWTNVWLFLTHQDHAYSYQEKALSSFSLIIARLGGIMKCHTNFTLRVYVMVIIVDVIFIFIIIIKVSRGPERMQGLFSYVSVVDYLEKDSVVLLSMAVGLSKADTTT